MLAQTIPPLSDKIQCCVDKELSVWLVNASETETVNVSCGELFGFNLGKFSEKTPGRGVWFGVLNSMDKQSFMMLRSVALTCPNVTGACRNPSTTKDGIPFMFEKDYALMVQLNGTTKMPTPRGSPNLQ